MIKKKYPILAILFSLMLASCGGGGSPEAPASSDEGGGNESSSTSTPTPTSIPEADPTLSFVTQGGTSIATVTGVKGATIDYSQYVTTKEGEEFLGWYGSEDGSRPAPTTFEGDQTVYAYWTGFPGALGFYFGHYPQSKVTDTALINKLKTARGVLDDFDYEGQKYHYEGGNDNKGDFYCYDLIKWNWSESNEADVYYLSSPVILDYQPMLTSIPYSYSTYDQKVRYASSFTNTDLYTWLNQDFKRKAFDEREAESLESEIGLPRWSGGWMSSDRITDWIGEASDWALAQVNYRDRLTPLENADGKVCYDYWFRDYHPRTQLDENRGYEPLDYYMRTAALQESNVYQYYDAIEKYHGVVPAVTVNIAETADRVIHFDTTGGSAIADVSTRAKINREATVTLPIEEPHPDDPDYVFAAWYKDANFTQRVEGNEYTFAPNETEVTLYAKWELDPTVYESAVTYHLNGGTLPEGAPAIVLSNASVLSQIARYEPTYDLYHSFVGWYLDEEFTQPLSDTFFTKKPIDLYAKWADIDPRDVDWAYTALDDGTCEIYPSGAKTFTGVVEIPSAKSDGTVVSKIAADAFKEITGITKLILPNSIVEVGARAFMKAGLSEIEWGSGLRKIDVQAFAFNNFETLFVPDVVYESDAFTFNPNLTTVTFASTLSSIPDTMFSYCTNLGDIVFPASVASISNWAFSACTIGSIRLNAGMSVGERAFSGSTIGKLYWDGNITAEKEAVSYMESLGEFHVGEAVTSLPSGLALAASTKAVIAGNLETFLAMENNDKLLSNGPQATFAGAVLSGEISIPEGTTTLPEGLFSNSNITKLVLPDSLQTIDASAFTGCTVLKEVDMPYSYGMVQNLPSCVEKLTIRHYNSTGTTYTHLTSLKELNILATDGSSASRTLNLRNRQGTGTLEKISIPTGLALLQYGLEGHPNLADVTVPTWYINNNYPAAYYFGNTNTAVKKLKVLGGQIDNNYVTTDSSKILPNLEELTIGSGVTSIGSYAFARCAHLTSVTFENPTVTKIGSNCFAYTSLTSFTLPASVTNCGENLFEGVTTITSLSVDPANPKYDSRDNCNCIIETSSNYVVVKIPTSVIPDSVTTAPANFFSDVNTDTFVVPSKYTDIRGYAFQGAHIRVLDLSANSATTLADYSLYGIEGLEEIILPSMTKTLSKLLYETPSTLTKVTVTYGTIIPEAAFQGQTTLTSIVLPEGLTAIPKQAFQTCRNLDGDLAFPNVTSVGDNAFQYCNAVDSIDLPLCETLGARAFANMATLQTVNFPNLETMGVGIFEDCAALDVITIPFYLSIANSSNDTYWRPFDGATVHGIIVEDGTALLLGTLFEGATIDYVVLPSTIRNAQSHEATTNASTSIGVVYYGGTDLSTFSTYLNGKDRLGNPNFFPRDVTFFSGANMKAYSETEKADCWHWVDGLPVAW